MRKGGVFMRIFSRSMVTVAVCSLACGASAQKDAPPDMNQIMQLMGAMAAQTNAQSKVAMVSFRDLKALLPAALDGMKRTNATGEKTGAMGMQIAKAEGNYENDQGSITIELSDTSGLGGLGGLAAMGWAMAEIDRETDSGFERTSTIQGYKAIEKYDTENKDGEIELMVDKRFTVKVSGSGVPFEALQKALGKIDLKKLAALKPEESKKP